MGQAQCCQSEEDGSNLDVSAAHKGSAKPPQEEAAPVFMETAEPASTVEAEAAAAPRPDPPKNYEQVPDQLSQKSESFMVSFDRGTPPGAFGARVDPSDGKFLFISSLESGDTMLNEHNKRVQEDSSYSEEVKASQYIVEINGKRGDARQLEALLATSAKLSIVFMKPTGFDCTVNRSGKSLGLELRYPCNHGTSLLIEAILPDGAAKAVTGPGRPQQNDRILTVNGKSGDCYSLLEGVKASTEMVHLGMCRLQP